MMDLGGIWLVVLLVLVLVLGGVAAALATSRGAGTGGQHDSERAHDILRRRLAAGEIDEDEYRERAELLGPARATGPAGGRWLPVALIVLAVRVRIALLAIGLGRPGDGRWGPMDGMMGPRTTQDTAPSPIPDADEITIEMTEMAFDPATIEVTAGEAINLVVTNRGEVFHDLTIDELDLQIGVDPGQTATAGLEVDEPGEYEYHCSVPGHTEAGMQGTLTVLDPHD